ncbi:MAG: hypothetical protein QOF36_2622 [Microbacteriaceae bacterium]|jgi:hypothetical protein|nr:hypothetical protein [Microbacteriaceae bacterium]
MTTVERSKARFEQETAEHVLTVIKDAGLYRHLRCQQPGTYIYGFDVVTWPGYLAIVGDAGDFVFSRIRDMFQFFRSDHGINPDYWSQKLQAPRPDGARVYSHDALRERVLFWARDELEYGEDGDMIYPSLLIEALEREVLYDWTLHPEEGRERLQLLEESVGVHLETWEWDLREYDWQFLWCCHAIAWAIARYDETATTVAGSEAA